MEGKKCKSPEGSGKASEICPYAHRSERTKETPYAFQGALFPSRGTQTQAQTLFAASNNKQGERFGRHGHWKSEKNVSFNSTVLNDQLCNKESRHCTAPHLTAHTRTYTSPNRKLRSGVKEGQPGLTRIPYDTITIRYATLLWLGRRLGHALWSLEASCRLVSSHTFVSS